MLPTSPEQPSLEIGDRVPDMGWIDATGRRVSLAQSAYAGRLSVLFVCAAAGAGGAARNLAKFRDLYDKFRALDVQLFAITSEPAPANLATAERLGLPFPVLVDAGFTAGRALGLVDSGAPAAAKSKRKARAACTLIVDPNQRILKRIAPAGEGKHAVPALAACATWASARSSAVVTTQAPVLLVPNVLGKEHCSRLIRLWETGDRYEGGVANAEYGRNVPVKQVKVRGDVALPDLGPEAQEMFAIFRRRLFPEIQKAYNFRVTRAETLRLGCYEAADGGRFIPHRDDTTPYTAHRRFAMSLNLNTGDYEGGYLRFPEYGPQLYQPEVGGAVVFSCSLLHEATRVTSGRRFVLLGFFYGEAEQALRDRIAAERETGGAGPSANPGPLAR
jgi:peroxiredoxin/predicted 2-oxoglutarate/Fe(II)-dependent dioxygenase YbiX